MTTNILVVGVGGQGVMTAAEIGKMTIFAKSF
jgi:Pyruvate/2-oxoacid:ferredoxin oxidoreductase gamma subunit